MTCISDENRFCLSEISCISKFIISCFIFFMLTYALLIVLFNKPMHFLLQYVIDKSCYISFFFSFQVHIPFLLLPFTLFLSEIVHRILNYFVLHIKHGTKYLKLTAKIRNNFRKTIHHTSVTKLQDENVVNARDSIELGSTYLNVVHLALLKSTF